MLSCSFFFFFFIISFLRGAKVPRLRGRLIVACMKFWNLYDCRLFSEKGPVVSQNQVELKKNWSRQTDVRWQIRRRKKSSHRNWLGMLFLGVHQIKNKQPKNKKQTIFQLLRDPITFSKPCKEKTQNFDSATHGSVYSGHHHHTSQKTERTRQ